ncbi:MAG: N-6 DNA methylase [Chitinophagales bacterium]|nr:N-6 DNA methylase [Chitinophagales bacterium]
MRDRKKTGSFYTPKIIADFLVSYLSDKLQKTDNISVLEPSAGDGIFVSTLCNHKNLSERIKKIVAVEKSKQELNKIIKEVMHKSLSAINSDFLEFQDGNKQKFSLVIGNPPYIKKSLLKATQIEYCKNIHHAAKLADNKPKNIWTAFLVRCIEFTAADGILAFVLPSELLQVKFAAELRELILKQFERVEIFTFNELLFKDCKGQDTLLLIGERKSEDKGIFYCNIKKLTDLEERKFTLAQNVKIKESKWTHHHLETEEIELLEKLKEQIQTVNDYCNSKAGIVTAANDYFIVDAKTVDEYSLHDFVKPIIQKGVLVGGSVELSEEDFQMLIDKSKPTYLIAIDKKTQIRSNAKFWKYKQIGEDRNLHKRYKTSRRENWFHVPNIGAEPEAFFFKRCNEYPKLIKNTANVLATDSAYTITMKNGFEIENLIYSFYNSLTLAFAELHGRYYGGGVLELTPNEFKKLPVPYLTKNANEFGNYVSAFKAKSSIKEICKQNDREILKSIDRNLSDDNIDLIYSIREKLYLRRIKTN